MEERKYYTPDLSEFFIGFEYETKGKNSDWEKRTFLKKQFVFESFPDPSNEYRVKFLDRSDIESEGWENYSYSDILKEAIWQMQINDKDYQLTLWIDGTVKIEWQDWEEEELKTIFVGTIRNISEFRKLQKQLNIK